MQDLLLLIAALIGIAIAMIAVGVWLAGRQARHNPYAESARALRTVTIDAAAAHRGQASRVPRGAPMPAARADLERHSESNPEAGAGIASRAPAQPPAARSGAGALSAAALCEAQAAAKAAVRDAGDADADAVDLEARAAQAVRNARADVSGSEALALRLQDRAKRARRYATLASQWAADARSHVELAAREPAAEHAALAIERAMQAATARRETQRLAQQRRARVRGLRAASR